jgi:hypothetical protein
VVTLTLADTTWRHVTRNTTPLNTAVHEAEAKAAARLGSAVHADEVVRVHDNTPVHNWEHCVDPVGPHAYAASASTPTIAHLLGRLERGIQEAKADAAASQLTAAALQQKAAAAQQTAAAAQQTAAAAQQTAAVAQQTADAALVPVVENLAVQVALYTVGITTLRRSRTTYFTRGPARNSHLVQLLADRGVDKPGQRLDTLVANRNASTHPSHEQDLLAKVVLLRSSLTDGVRHRTHLACIILDNAEALIQGRGSGGGGGRGQRTSSRQ